MKKFSTAKYTTKYFACLLRRKTFVTAIIAIVAVIVCSKYSLSFEPHPPTYQVRFIWSAITCYNQGIIADCQQSTTIWYLDYYLGLQPGSNTLKPIYCPPGSGSASPIYVQVPTAHQYYTAKNNGIRLYTVGFVSPSTMNYYFGEIFVTDFHYNSATNTDTYYGTIPTMYCL